MPPSADVLSAVRGNLTDLLKAQPLALGAVGLAIGAGIAAALPNTDIEKSYLRESSETLRNKTSEIADQEIEKETTVATAVVETVADEACKQGLTIDDAKEAMDDLSDRVGRVVDAAGKSVSEAAAVPIRSTARRLQVGQWSKLPRAAPAASSARLTTPNAFFESVLLAGISYRPMSLAPVHP